MNSSLKMMWAWLVSLQILILIKLFFCFKYFLLECKDSGEKAGWRDWAHCHTRHFLESCSLSSAHCSHWHHPPAEGTKPSQIAFLLILTPIVLLTSKCCLLCILYILDLGLPCLYLYYCFFFMVFLYLN